LFLKKLTYTSPASRNAVKFAHDWWYQKKNNKLSLKIKSKAGRSTKGRLVIRTKTSILRKLRSIKINYNYRYQPLGLVTTFQLIPFRNLVVSLVLYANGALTYLTKGLEHRAFKYLIFARNSRERKFRKHAYYSWIVLFSKLSLISLVELIPGTGAKYCRSSGTFAKLKKLDMVKQSAVIKFPKTQVVKITSFYSIACLGKVDLPQKRKYVNLKSGYWRSFGVKPIVRGVARNPVDHPHGGRTKAIKYPRTPWGKTTKFK